MRSALCNGRPRERRDLSSFLRVRYQMHTLFQLPWWMTEAVVARAAYYMLEGQPLRWMLLLFRQQALSVFAGIQRTAPGTLARGAHGFPHRPNPTSRLLLRSLR